MPGTYPMDGGGLDSGLSIGPGFIAGLFVGTLDAGITAVSDKGTLTLTEAGDTFAGTFAVTLLLRDGGSGTLSGTFVAPYCPLDAINLSL